MEETIDSNTSQADIEQASANIDKRGRLDEEVFSYRESKDKVFVVWHKKQVLILKGKQARKLIDKIAHLDGKDHW